jgi:general L-amino acid transport system permease protein
MSRALTWMKTNLFATPLDAIATVAALWLLSLALSAAVDWAIVTAVFTGSDGRACAGPNVGACWPFVTHKLGLFIYGRYPEPERWRVDLVYALAVGALAALSVPRVRASGPMLLGLAVGVPLAAALLLTGSWLGLRPVPTELWGGLLVTLVVASVGIVAALPLGILLALARRSQLPLVQLAAVGFIEVVRGIPLITVLFMASVMLPLFLPAGVTLDKLLRVLVGVALFASAYMAEVIRGGLQAIPRGQFDAAGPQPHAEDAPHHPAPSDRGLDPRHR